MRLLDYELSPLCNVLTRDGVRNVISMRDISDGILQKILSITQRKFYVQQRILNISRRSLKVLWLSAIFSVISKFCDILKS